ncbi:MAG: hypothetical protein V7L22_04820 [Nostoc sp.]
MKQSQRLELLSFTLVRSHQSKGWDCFASLAMTDYVIANAALAE